MNNPHHGKDDTMTGIIDRLRAADISGHGSYSALVREAADTIEELARNIDGSVRIAAEALKEVERLKALILDGCKVFEHYDLPEHALHYRRALERGADDHPVAGWPA